MSEARKFTNAGAFAGLRAEVRGPSNGEEQKSPMKFARFHYFCALQAPRVGI
jgi:hypothetical protein